MESDWSALLFAVPEVFSAEDSDAPLLVEVSSCSVLIRLLSR